MTGTDFPTQDDEISLSRKLADFDKALTAAERMLFRARIITDLSGDDDVEGHLLERRWTATKDGAYFEWVHIDENGEQSGQRRKVDPRIWDTLRGSTTAFPEAARALRAEGTT